MPVWTAALAGLIFGLGLIVSGMTNPAKVQGFLDVLGTWDPSLALVMASRWSAANTPPTPWANVVLMTHPKASIAAWCWAA
jgi:uncharacterized membrane protein YedE/YeeE